jgi:tRNA (guanine37-N1)-methyltransferase
VPDVLVSGHHARIDRWRRRAALARTMRERPDLLDGADLDDEERALLLALGGEGADHERD